MQVTLSFAAHVNDVQDEINAIETDLVNGLQRALRPDSTANNRDLGTSTALWRDLWLGRTINLQQGTITADAQAWASTAVWNNVAVAFVHKDTNITDTASAGASVLERWRIGGVEKVSILKTGLITIRGGTGLDFTTGATATIGTTDAFDLSLKRGGATKLTLGASSALFTDLVQTAAGSATNPGVTVSDSGLGLFRQAANVLSIATSAAERVRFDAAQIGMDSALVARMLAQNRFRYLNSMVRVVRTTAQSIPNVTFTLINWDSETFDTDNMHDNVTNNTRLVAQIAGKYRVSAHVSLVANATGIRSARIIVNGAAASGARVELTPGAGTEATMCLSTTVSLAAAGYVEVDVYQSSGAALNTTADATYMNFSMEYIGE